ncbi:MAG: capsular biosynthesis protein [Bacteroidia bacterium]|nr:capsular biosynthesis protein [Bacteroidia bacterium]
MSFLGTLFGGKSKRPPVDLSVLGTDLHSHFIPGLDDGAQTIEDALALLQAMSAFGYRKVITTPHVMSDHFRNDSGKILGGLDKLRAAASEAGIPLVIEAAAEYYLDYELEKKLGNEKLLTLGKNYLLFELSFMQPPDNLYHFIFEAQMAGYKPVLAHPERYPFWITKFGEYEKLCEKGALLQMNINSLTGYYSPAVKVLGEKLIRAGLISFLGSDCHHMGHIHLMQKAVQEPMLHDLMASGKLLNQTL